MSRHTDTVEPALDEAVAGLGLDAQPTKQDGLEAADATGNAFVQLFTTFGSFSMAAGILLIFLIFVMLAAERRPEMGMARAVGTQRRHLVQTFLYEGAAYDLLAAAVGAVLGIGVSFVMVQVGRPGLRHRGRARAGLLAVGPQPPHRLRPRRPPHLGGRHRLGVAGQPPQHRQRHPRPPRERRRRPPPCGAGCSSPSA